MPKGLRETSNRIKSVKSTAQITRAMQLVASSKMKRAQDTALAGRDYGRLFIDILDSALARLDGANAFSELPLLRPREIRTRGILLVSTDKGLCGSLNANLFRLLPGIPADGAKFVAVGRKGAQQLARTGRELLLEFPASDHVHFAATRPVGDRLLKLYQDGVVDTVEILFTRFKNTLIQEAVLQPVLPITDIHVVAAKLREQIAAATGAATTAGTGATTTSTTTTTAAATSTAASVVAAAADKREIAFEPGANAVLAELPALFVKHAVYHAILEAKASEHSARMVAMKAATDNAGKITESLTIEFNKVRQAAITQEINEITAAAGH